MHIEAAIEVFRGRRPRLYKNKKKETRLPNLIKFAVKFTVYSSRSFFNELPQYMIFTVNIMNVIHVLRTDQRKYSPLYENLLQ